MPASTLTHESVTAVIDAGAWTSSESSLAAITTATVGTRLGRYLVIEELGRGGMGVVVRAYDPKLQREVALKLVRLDALDASAQARLVREARAMARLSHPNVVAVYDVELGDGVIVVMEYVPGTTLGKWLEDGTRSYKEIVERFIAAGQGLSAAHAEGLLHRDFKLDNVLVGHDGRVRVTDFGLARATGSSLSSEDARRDVSNDAISADDPRPSEDGISVELTVAGTVMGTPVYMAPEQTEGGDLDARTDQYAYCVGLWRALTGRWPFEGRGRTLVHAKHGDVPRWSRVAAPRHIVEALRRGLAAAPAQRWPSMPALLAELGRDPSRRRRRLLAAGMLALTAVGVWGVQNVQRARTLAACARQGAAIDEVWNDARAEAIATAFAGTGLSYAAGTWSRSRERLDDYAQQWTSTRRGTCELAEVQNKLTPELAQASGACLDEHRERLDALLRQLEQPDATVIQTAATATASLPLVDACTDENQLRHRVEPPSDPDVREQVRALRSRLSRASAAHATGRYAEALEQAQAVRDEASALDWRALVVEAQLAVADAHVRLGRYEDARTGYEEVFFTAGASARDALALRASTDLVFIVGNHLARHDEGLQWGRASQMLVGRLGLSEDLVESRLLNNLASVHAVAGAYEHAEALYDRALAIKEKALGPEHPDVAMSLNNLANLHRDMGAYEDAKALHEHALVVREKALGPEHPDVAASLNNLAGVHEATGAYEDAKALYDRALAILEKSLGSEHPEVAAALNNLANVYNGTGEYEDAKALYDRTLAILEQALGSEHPHVAAVLNNLANVYRATGAYEDAKALHERALVVREKALGPEHPDVAMSLNNLAAVHAATGAYEDAKALHERALAIREKALGPEHPDLADSLVGLAEIALQGGRAADAVRLAKRAVLVRQKSDTPALELAQARFLLARALIDAGKSQVDAIALAEQARDAYRKAGGDALVEVERWLDRSR